MSSKKNHSTDELDLSSLEESELEELYTWVDKIPLSRPKRDICRDFSDGVLTAEVVKFFLPKMVDIHNYTAGSSTQQKMQNWLLLNRKVFTKLNFQLTEDLIRDICTCKRGLIERILMHLRAKIERAMWDMQKDAGIRHEQAQIQQKSSVRMHGQGFKGSKGNVANDKPEADQNIGMPNITNNSMRNVNPQKQVSPGRQKVPMAGPYKGKVKTIAAETVPRAVYEEKEQECLAKEETIQILQAKVRRLEHLLHLKDIRIEDLQNRIESSRPTGLTAAGGAKR